MTADLRSKTIHNLTVSKANRSMDSGSINILFKQTDSLFKYIYKKFLQIIVY